jgi:hypothetical protein
MRILFLDDMEERWHRFQQARLGQEIDWAETAEAAIRFLRENTYDLISLDHDLVFEHYFNVCDHKDGLCGMIVAEFIAAHPGCFDRSTIDVHTFNELAGQQMISKLRSAGLNAEYLPFDY